jgi:hypothetical protein
MSVPLMWRIWGKELGLETKPVPPERRRKNTIFIL